MTAVNRLFIGALLALLFSALFPGKVHAQTPLRVALLAVDGDARVNDVISKLSAAGLTDVTPIDVATGTPTLTDLQPYDVIFTWSNSAYADSGSLGDVLADYVDHGGGVVQALFSFDPNTPLDGRWRAEAYEPFSISTTHRAMFLTLDATQAGHPILDGVSSFNGGGFSFHGNVQPQGCADVVARWSNGRPLVAARVGPNGGRVIGLNFYPPSNQAGNPDFWVASTHGGILMANALRYAASPVPTPSTSDGPTVALLVADGQAHANDVKCKLQNLNLFSRVDTIDVQATTPPLPTLLNYDALLTWTNSSYNNAAGLGDVLAAYVDQNRGVVQSPFSFSVPSTPLLGGSWQANGYRPLAEASPVTGNGLTLVPLAPGHAVLSGVSNFHGGTGSHHGGSVTPDGAPQVIAAWSDGSPLVALGTADSGGRLVGLNMYPPSSDVGGNFWNSASDGARLIANTLLFAANHFPTANAGADQVIEATSATGVSFTLNATGTDLDGDALTFSWSGAASATGQSVTLDVPPPAAPSQSQQYVVNLRVIDGHGGEAIDSVVLTVTDHTGPVLHGVPNGIVSVEATSSSGATVTFGPMTATDAVDGTTPVVCSPASGSVFPVRDTTVTCSSTDSRGNSSSSSFTVRVTAASTSTAGKAFGYGLIRDAEHHYEFVFAAIEKPSGREEGGLVLTVKSEHRGRKSRPRNDHFLAKTLQSVTFSQESSVLFSGTGRWNGAANYRYEVSAVNKSKLNRRYRDVVRITIKAPGGAVVAHVDGVLSAGDIQVWTK
jgi:HYR domain